MSLPKKKKLVTNIPLTSLNAICGCGRPKLSDVHEPTPIIRKPKSSSTTTTTTTSSSTRNSVSETDHLLHHKQQQHDHQCYDQDGAKVATSRIGNAIAVVKDSDDPYHDFRHSMLQMIFEKEIYSEDGLRELVNCFLDLNSRFHRDIILRVFNEIRNDMNSRICMSR